MQKMTMDYSIKIEIIKKNSRHKKKGSESHTILSLAITSATLLATVAAAAVIMKSKSFLLLYQIAFVPHRNI
jgi:hypothetical protein